MGANNAWWLLITSVQCISPAKGFLRETYKSQNIIAISQTPKFTLFIIQIKVKSLSIVFSGSSSIRNKIICAISISDFNLTQKSGVCVRSKCLLIF